MGTTYVATGSHMALATISDYAILPPPQQSYWLYDDFFYFGVFQYEGEPDYSLQNTWFGPGPDTERKQSTLHVGDTVSTVSTQVPTASRIVSPDQSNRSADCPPGQAGWDRIVHKVVTDQETPAGDIALAGQILTETVTIGNPNDFGFAQVQNFIG